MPDTLDPLRLPLQGSQLIEASAGTGKTWTIAALYLRLVLGHGGAPRLPGEILVMTFTKAATRELSDRIRRRLVEAAARFRGEAVATDDAFLAALLADFPDGPTRQQAAWRLGMAAEAMDDAAIFTIDAWCQRMLREHAFDSGCLFDEELQAQEAAMQAEAVRDYWRQQVYPLVDAELGGVLAQWPDVDALAAGVRSLVGKSLPADAGEGSLAEAVARGVRQREQAVAALKIGWTARADAMRDWLGAIWADKKHPARKAVPSEAHACRWIDALKAWADDPAVERPDITETAIKRLAAACIRDGLRDLDFAMEVPACFGEFEQLIDGLDSLPDAGNAPRLHAAAWITRRLQLLKQQAGSFGFADMLDRLDAALDETLNGARAQRLRQRIIEQYPVALIDEFQDTSPVQLRIFDRLYRIADDEPARALLLIGDPKQAIYSFRGADIYSYLSARRATQGRHHMLGTNHRSTQALVRAVNAIFETAETRVGDGAFMYGRGDESDLPFVDVAARGRAERLVDAAGDVAPVTLVHDGVLRGKGESRGLFAALCAERMVTLLNDPQAGFAGEDGAFQRLRPADMAVLVRNGIEADAVRHEMRRRGLASVYLSDKDTVFETPEAGDLLRLMQAVNAPRDARLARAALASHLLGFSLPQLVAFATDDERFDQQCELLQRLNLIWKGQGVLAMVRRALHDFDLPARWLGAPDRAVTGERRLTNVLHLAELLQAASVQAEGEQALIRWLAQQIAAGEDGSGGGDELVLRLESDADLVKVVTIHKSKGLEYPLVFLPFPTDFREVFSQNESAKVRALVLPGEDGRGELVLSPSRAQMAAAEKERQREHLRLLYVAMTRARHALWVGLASLKVGNSKACVWERSAIGYLLSGPEPQDAERRREDVLAHAGADVRVELLPLVDEPALPATTHLLSRGVHPPLVPAQAYRGRIDRGWSISSYSALVRDAAWATAASGAVPQRPVLEDEPGESDGVGRPLRAADPPWHRFPRGAFAGNFLHDQLEWLADQRFALGASEELALALVRRCERQGWGHRADDVVAWLRLVCVTPLPPLGTALDALAATTPEMEFWFPSDGIQTQHVDDLCRQHLFAGHDRPHLPERTLKGMLMGFADLVFEHAGRYWVLDYKSNALGSHDGDYTPQAMADSMLEHRYDVQAALYLLALHRLLKARLGAAYVPERQLGGAIYLFLRGVAGPTAGCCTVAPPLALLDELDTLMQRAAASSGEPA